MGEEALRLAESEGGKALMKASDGVRRGIGEVGGRFVAPLAFVFPGCLMVFVVFLDLFGGV